MIKKIISNNIYLLNLLKQLLPDLSFELKDTAIKSSCDEEITISISDKKLVLFFYDKLKNDEISYFLDLPFKIESLVRLINSIISSNLNEVCYSLKNEVKFYPRLKKIFIDEEDIIMLTEIESNILVYLFENINHIVSLKELYKEIFNQNIDLSTHKIENHIYNLRQKLKEYDKLDIINTTENGYIIYS